MGIFFKLIFSLIILAIISTTCRAWNYVTDLSLPDSMSDSCIYLSGYRFYNLNSLGKNSSYFKTVPNSSGDILFLSFCHDLPQEAFDEANCEYL